MAMLGNTNEVIIHAGNWRQFVDPYVNGERKARGLIPRNYATHPVGSYPWATAVDFPLIPRSEWSQRIKDMEAQKSRLSDIRMYAGPNGGMIPSRDQNGRGYCWRHSGTSAHLLARAVMGEPYADLSAYAGACRIKHYRDEGGWGAQGVDDLIQFGDPTSDFWPQRAVDPKYDTPETWANAKLHRVIDQWADLNAAEYDRKLTFDQNITLLLSRVPTVDDFNWWSHSVCGADAVDGAAQFGKTRVESGKLATLPEHDAIWAMDDEVTGGTGLRIWNSWGDSWSEQGMGVLTGSHATPDASVAPRLVRPSA